MHYSIHVIQKCGFHLQATAEANNLTAVALARETYTTLMEEVCGGNKPFLSTGHLEAEHTRIKEKALNMVGSCV